MRIGAALICWLSVIGAVCLGPANAEEAPRKLRVVIDDNYPPYTFKSADGKPQGILRDVWRLWQQKTGIPVDFIATDWGIAQNMMKTRQADAIDTMFETPERKKFYDFSAPHAKINTYIFFHKSIAGITNAESAKGFVVGVKAGDACIEYLQAKGISDLKPYPSYQALVKAAVQRSISVICIDGPPAFYFFAQEGAINSFRYTEPLYSGEFHWAIAKGQPALKALIAKGFASITPAERTAIEKHWYGEGMPDKEMSDWVIYGAYGFAAVIAALLGMLAWSRFLKRQVDSRTAALSQAMAALEDSEAYNKALFASSQMPMVVMDADTYRFIDCNAAAQEIYHLPSRDKVLGLTPADVSDETQYDGSPSSVAAERHIRIARKKKSHLFEWRHRRPDGEIWDAQVHLMLIEYKGKQILLFALLDITDRKRYEKEIETLAFHDSLTGLPNRRLMLDRLRQSMLDSARSGKQGALLLIDLDNFKTLNDTRGHDLGDKLLIEVSQRLLKNVRDGDTVARLGGDEFVIILRNLSPDDHADIETERIAENLLKALGAPYLLVEHSDTQETSATHFCSASMGIALFRGTAVTAEELLQRADTAMYRAKESGRDAFRFFDPDMQARILARVALEDELRRAIEENQFILHFQPQVNSQHQIIGAEVLIRWQHPVRGMISPLDFIPLAEETGLIVPIGHWVLDQACLQLARWANQPNTANLALSVNVSARQFGMPGFENELREHLQKTAGNQHKLKIELTESVLLENTEATISKMFAIKSMQVMLSLDDFGTGFSSLSYLSVLPLDQLKIDRSFVRDILVDPNDAAIARTIIALGKSLGMSVIAEGVETASQKAFLERVDCHIYQGYLFGRPVPIADFETMLDETPAQ
ncbi:EAL domain-containing protein [Leeia oryzae]|uniref:EAL domain-containing protein n=1 Tax=Leeia oryzae TaxID=356662 RepID=UPI00037AB580|nr:EAL domain-containing protein [Leeia oryzae]